MMPQVDNQTKFSRVPLKITNYVQRNFLSSPSKTHKEGFGLLYLVEAYALHAWKSECALGASYLPINTSNASLALVDGPVQYNTFARSLFEALQQLL